MSSDKASLEVKIEGSIGEKADIFNIAPGDAKEIIIDFEKISYINSIGVKNWIFWMGRFPQNAIFRFKNCPSAIVNQVNMVKGFLPDKGTVESFSIPYFCETCSKEEIFIARRGVDFEFSKATESSWNKIPESRSCSKCGGEMEMDIVPEKYFAFLKKILG